MPIPMMNSKIVIAPNATAIPARYPKAIPTAIATARTTRAAIKRRWLLRDDLITASRSVT